VYISCGLYVEWQKDEQRNAEGRGAEDFQVRRRTSTAVVSGTAVGEASDEVDWHRWTQRAASVWCKAVADGDTLVLRSP